MLRVLLCSAPSIRIGGFQGFLVAYLLAPLLQLLCKVQYFLFFQVTVCLKFPLIHPQTDFGCLYCINTLALPRNKAPWYGKESAARLPRLWPVSMLPANSSRCTTGTAIPSAPPPRADGSCLPSSSSSLPN